MQMKLGQGYRQHPVYANLILLIFIPQMTLNKHFLCNMHLVRKYSLHAKEICAYCAQFHVQRKNICSKKYANVHK